MAIRILNSREQIKDQFQEMPEQALRQIINLKIKTDGTVVNSDGSTLEILNLGNKGEDWATILHFELEDKKITNEIKGDVTLYDRYIPKLHFKWMNATEEDESVISSIEFNGVDLAVPAELTSLVGEYELIYTLQERRIGLDNITQRKEMFISSVFKGEVKDSLVDYCDSATEFDPIIVKEETLKKESIKISFDEQKRPVIEESGNQRLGFECDSYITDIVLGELTSVFTSAILFVKDESSALVVCDNNNKTWIPREITNKPGIYQMMICAWDESGATFLSDTFEMEVVENFLAYSEDVYAKEENSVILDRNGQVIYVLRTTEE